MVNSHKPDIRASLERAEAQPLGVLSERVELHLKLAVWASSITAALGVAYFVVRWLFLGGTFSHPLLWRVLGFADYVLAVMLSLVASLWVWYFIVRWREGRAGKPTGPDSPG